MPDNTGELDPLAKGAIVSFHNASTGLTHIGVVRDTPYTQDEAGLLVRVASSAPGAYIPIIYEFRGNIRKINKHPEAISVFASEDGLSDSELKSIALAREALEYDDGLKAAQLKADTYKDRSFKY